MAKTITIEIEMGNAAFDEREGFEAAGILRHCAGRIDGLYRLRQSDGLSHLSDSNGNRVGHMTISDAKEE